MKAKHLLFAASILVSAGMYAQGIPTHPMYVDFGENTGTPSSGVTKDYAALLDAWEPGKPLTLNAEGYVDDNFFISRVRKKDRFFNVNSQAHKELTDDTDKKFCWWGPIGEMTKQWGPLPRYNFEADNFSMWQYLDSHGNWSNSWFRVPAAMLDVAHKNGVPTGCLYFIDWAASVTESSDAGKPLADLCAKDGTGNFKYARKLVQMMKYYGIDGLGINPEGTWSMTLNTNFQDFLRECHRIGREEENWDFQVYWYAFVSNSGNLSDGGSALTSNHTDWFSKNGENTTDMYMLNYNWGGKLSSSTNIAKGYTDPATGKTRERDIYAGFDQQGRGYGNYGGSWSELSTSPAGIVVWGAHDRNQLHISSTDNGSSDVAIQTTYANKQEMLFTGGTRNVLDNPPLVSEVITASTSDLQKFHGYSKFVLANSTLTELPFVTRFNLGNGERFNNEGVTTFAHKWYNIGMQDYLPTWRWWIEDGEGNVPADAIQCDFTFDDAWFGGSCLRVHGATTRSDVHMFKTKFEMNAGCKISVTYKVENGTDPKMKVIASKEGSEDTFTEVALPVSSRSGAWETYEFDAADLGMDNGTMAVLGIRVEGTEDNYSTLLGEMSIIDPSVDYATVTPVITHAELMNLQYNGVDGKIVFDMPFTGERPAEYDGCPIYNDEVGAWYYEIYLTQDGCDPVLVTTTTSWAAYFVEVPALDASNPYFQIGVRAVSPDGKNGSEIVWSEDLTTEMTIVDDVSIDKPVIKPGEEFTLAFDDPNHEADRLRIIYSATDEVVKDETVKSLTTSLEDLGPYDVIIGDGDNALRIRGFFQITPEATGRMPQVVEISSDKKSVVTGEPVNYSVEVERGEGSVSQALFINDPQALCIPAAISSNGSECTYAMWFKVDTKFQHASLGTNLIHKYDINGQKYHGMTWTEDEWGECWVSIRTENYSDYNNADGEVSAAFFSPYAGAPNYEHNNDVDIITKGYSLTPDVWTHIAVVRSGKIAMIYLNGKQAASGVIRSIDFNQTMESGYGFAQYCDIFIGGSMLNLSGLVGYVDEVQIWDKALNDEEVKASMEGYGVAPDGLVGYFDFEEVATDDEGQQYFPNLGTNASVAGAYLVEVKTTDDVSETEAKNPSLTTGVPAIEGVMPITFTGATWQLEGATEVNQGDLSATAEYAQAGTYPVSVTVTNTWGSTTKTIDEYLMVSVGIEDGEVVEDYSLYPNPFVDQATILFAKGGNYVVNIFDAQGRKVADKVCTAEDHEAVTLTVDGPSGMYLVNITLNGKSVKTFKVNKTR